MDRGKFRASLISVSIASLVLRWFVPPAPVWYSPHDDLLMVRLAAQIRAGNWLGDYTNLGHLTLAKPAGYPLFLAWTHFLPWAPTVTVHLMVLAGLLLICRELRRAGAPRALALGLFTAGAFFPSFFGDQMSRIYRDGFLTGLTVLAVGVALRIGSLLGEHRTLAERGRRSIAALVGTSALLGVCLSWYVATKPSWYPLALVTFLLVGRSYPFAGWSTLKRQAPVLALVVGCLAVSSSSVVGYVVVNNQRNYEIARLDTFAAGPYVDAINSWVSVEPRVDRPYVLVDSGQRSDVYEVSQTARVLQPFLEGTPGVGWRHISCESLMAVCDESGAWFTWELRDAVGSAGFDGSATEFEETLARLASEISAACDDGRVRCGGRGLAPGVLPLSRISPRVAFDSAFMGASTLVGLAPSSQAGSPQPEPPAALIDIWNDTVRGLPSTDSANKYRQDFLEARNTQAFLSDIYRLVWPLLVLVSVAGYAVSRPSARRLDAERIIGFVSLVGMAGSVAQLALLEASSGLYMFDGRYVYLLPAHVFMIVFVGHGLLRLWRSPLTASMRLQSGSVDDRGSNPAIEQRSPS